MLLPTQSAPPFAGAGFVQVLDLVLVPPPQSTEHSDHPVHTVHFPSTEISFSAIVYSLQSYKC